MVTGENTMHGIHNGLQTLIDKAVFDATDKNTIRVWCGLHQLDLAAQKGYQAISGGNFSSPKAVQAQKQNGHTMSSGCNNKVVVNVKGAHMAMRSHENYS